MRAAAIAFLTVMLHAAPGGAVAVGFDGVLSTVDDPNGLLGAEYQVGAPFAGVYDFSSDDAQVLFPGTGDNSAVYTLTAGHFSVAVQETEFFVDLATASASLNITHDSALLPVDSWSFGVAGPPSPDPDFRLGLSITFLDETHTQLSTEDFFVNTTLDGWTSAEFRVISQRTCSPDCGLGTALVASGTISNLVPVPEPAPSITLAMGLAALALRRRLTRPCS